MNEHFFYEFAIECDHDIDLLEKNHDRSDSDVVPKNCLETAKTLFRNLRCEIKLIV